MAADIQKWTVAPIQALIFEVMEIRFAVDLDQVDEMLELKDENPMERVRLDEIIPFPVKRVVYQDPRILMIPGSGGMTALQIDRPLDIHRVQVEAMQAFPGLIEMCRSTEAIWGVAMIDDFPVLLLDCQKLAVGGGVSSPS